MSKENSGFLGFRTKQGREPHSDAPDQPAALRSSVASPVGRKRYQPLTIQAAEPSVNSSATQYDTFAGSQPMKRYPATAVRPVSRKAQPANPQRSEHP